MVGWQRLDLALQLHEVGVQWISDCNFLLRNLFYCRLSRWFSALIYNILSDLDVEEVRDQVILLLHLLHRRNNEKSHLLHAKVVWDIRVELAAQVCQTILFISLDSILDLAQDLVALEYGLFWELTEWHSFHVDVHRDDTRLHELLVEEELYQGLHRSFKSGRQHLFLLVLDYCELGLGCVKHAPSDIVFIVRRRGHLDLSVPLASLSSCLLGKHLETGIEVEICCIFYAIDADSSKPRVQLAIETITCQALALYQLHDIELVLVALQVAPVEVGWHCRTERWILAHYKVWSLWHVWVNRCRLGRCRLLWAGWTGIFRLFLYNKLDRLLHLSDGLCFLWRLLGRCSWFASLISTCSSHILYLF